MLTPASADETAIINRMQHQIRDIRSHSRTQNSRTFLITETCPYTMFTLMSEERWRVIAVSP